jgi:hypothetical protein
MSGTSMAAGVAIAIAALALASNPEIRPPELVKILQKTGHPVPNHRSIRLIDAGKLLSELMGE